MMKVTMTNKVAHEMDLHLEALEIDSERSLSLIASLAEFGQASHYSNSLFILQILEVEEKCVKMWCLISESPRGEYRPSG
jgi:hypothetical protein